MEKKNGYKNSKHEKLYLPFQEVLKSSQANNKEVINENRKERSSSWAKQIINNINFT